MFKVILIYLSILIHFGALPQNGLYLKPSIESKFYRSFLSGGGEIYQNEHFKASYTNWGLDENVFFGLGIGYNFKNDLNGIEIYLAQDRINVNSINVSRYQYTPPSIDGVELSGSHSYGLVNQSGTGFIEAVRFDLLFQHQLNKLYNSSLILGMGGRFLTPLSGSLVSTDPTFISLPSGDSYIDAETGMIHVSSSYLSPDTKLGVQEVYINGLRRFNTHLQLGTKWDLHYANKRLFSLSIFYIQGINSFIQSHQIKTIEFTNQQIDERYYYNSYSRGSGFYLQLSRDIYVKKKSHENED